MPRLISVENYIDKERLPTLVNLVSQFSKQDLDKLLVDVGELNVGTSINWKSAVVYDTNGSWSVGAELQSKARSIIEFARTVPGVNRITINFLQKYSFMPIHIDDESKSEYDDSGQYYNIILPVNDHGWSIVDFTVIKNKIGEPLIFSGQVPHGAMNDTLETRITIYMIVEKKQFKHVSA